MPVWSDAISENENRRKEIVMVYRKAALRHVAAYSNVSTEVVCVLAGMPLLEIAADKRKRAYGATEKLPSKSG